MIESPLDPNVYDRNDYEPVIKLTHHNSKREVIPTTGLTDLDIWISATEGGNEIHATLKARATELLPDAPGYYTVTFLGDDIHTKLFVAPANYDKKDVFITARNVANNVNTLERVKALKIRRVS